ncbi:TonB-dependent receptor [Phenylobacterium sp. LjRoot164]|uniref:TonB-dependent receptor n=1 Tax=unclassified Phenylobacterium TaxID=2640670 RepID=UPI003ECF6952
MPLGGKLRAGLIASVSAGALAATSAYAQETNVIEELVVTAQKREESLQDVPIAVSAFNQESLDRRGIDGGQNLQEAIPNVTFSRTNGGGFNFVIRGIGSKTGTVTGDAATGIHLNNAPLTTNTLADADFYDVERVEVLRGPQGTLFGRNATGGVVNIITAKPKPDFGANARLELGDYSSIKLRGMINLPIAENLAVRLAGVSSRRDGFGNNIITGSDIDDRDLYGLRGTIAWEPTDRLATYFMWDHFREDDHRSRIGKQYCSKDEGPTSVGGASVSTNPVTARLQRGLLGQGCRATSVYASDALGTPNYLAAVETIFALRGGLVNDDPYAGKMQTPGLYDIESRFDPIYENKSDVALWNTTFNITDQLTLTSLTSWSETKQHTKSDYTRARPTTTFLVTPVTPGGVLNDPQIGLSDRMSTYDDITVATRQWTQELRLQSDFDGPVNFNVGGIYLDYANNNRQYIIANGFTGFRYATQGTGDCPPASATCIYVDPNNPPSGDGHNYFLSQQPYRLKASAAFGELYWKPVEGVKVTGGLRYTEDEKVAQNIPTRILQPGRGYPPGTPPEQKAKFDALTGRFGVDWQPELSFTSDTLVYAFYSKGYKGGGLNPAAAVGFAGVTEVFDPEYVNAYEIGTKNTLLDGSLRVNVTAFYYDYKNYQVSKIANRQSVIENVDAEVYGADFEVMWSPLPGLQLNGSLGLLDSSIKNGASIDTFDRTAGNPNFAVIKSITGQTCIAPPALIASAINAVNAGAPITSMLTVCLNPAASEGIAKNLEGNQLPNAPKSTLNLGAQYDWTLVGDWEASVRADYYRQGETFARVYNTEADRLNSRENINLSAQVSNPTNGVTLEAFVKNLTNEQDVQDFFLSDSVLFRNGFITDPRTYGVAVTKSF